MMIKASIHDIHLPVCGTNKFFLRMTELSERVAPTFAVSKNTVPTNSQAVPVPIDNDYLYRHATCMYRVIQM